MQLQHLSNLPRQPESGNPGQCPDLLYLPGSRIESCIDLPGLFAREPACRSQKAVNQPEPGSVRLVRARRESISDRKALKVRVLPASPDARERFFARPGLHQPGR